MLGGQENEIGPLVFANVWQTGLQGAPCRLLTSPIAIKGKNQPVSLFE